MSKSRPIVKCSVPPILVRLSIDALRDRDFPHNHKGNAYCRVAGERVRWHSTWSQSGRSKTGAASLQRKREPRIVLAQDGLWYRLRLRWQKQKQPNKQLLTGVASK